MTNFHHHLLHNWEQSSLFLLNFNKHLELSNSILNYEIISVYLNSCNLIWLLVAIFRNGIKKTSLVTKSWRWINEKNQKWMHEIFDIATKLLIFLSNYLLTERGSIVTALFPPSKILYSGKSSHQHFLKNNYSHHHLLTALISLI